MQELQAAVNEGLEAPVVHRASNAKPRPKAKRPKKRAPSTVVAPVPIPQPVPVEPTAQVTAAFHGVYHELCYAVSVLNLHVLCHYAA